MNALSQPSCPSCHGGAVISTRMRNAPEVEVRTCSACGLSWSGLPCDSRVCWFRAVVMCGECNKPKCANHGFHGRSATRQGICDACVKRTHEVVKASRRAQTRAVSNWHRTGGLHHE